MTRASANLFFVLTMLTPVPGMAQGYPSKPVHVIVPFAAGAGTDVFARVIGAKLADSLKQSFVVENRTGAGSTIGTAIVAHAPADGHTLLFNGISMAFNATLYTDLPYDTLKDFAPVTVVAMSPNVLTVTASGPFKSAADLIRFAKSSPGKLNYGSGGVGGSDHVCAEYFLSMTGTKALNVTYKGGAPALVDLAGGKLDFVIVSAFQMIMPLVKAGRVRTLAVSTASRMPLLPDVPTIAESGVPGFDYATWYAIWAPAGTPRPVLTELNAEIRQALQAADVRERLAALGAEPAWKSVDDATAFVKTEVAKWAPIIRTFNQPPK